MQSSTSSRISRIPRSSRQLTTVSFSSCSEAPILCWGNSGGSWIALAPRAMALTARRCLLRSDQRFLLPQHSNPRHLAYPARGVPGSS